jgi:signal transduction histidine kinase
MAASRFRLRLMPGGIAARIALTIFVAMVLVQALNGVLYIVEGRETPRFPNSPQFADEVSGLVNQVEAMPDNERRAFVATLANPLVKVDWFRRLRRPVPPPTILALAVQRERLRHELDRRVEIEEDIHFGPQTDSGRAVPVAAELAEGEFVGELEQPYRIMRVAVQLRDSSWLTFSFDQPFRSFDFERLGMRLGIAGLVIALVSVWLARRMVHPIDEFAHAATRLGLDPAAPPLVESGPREVREATQAFNQMQERLRRFVDDRTQMLAAISHDLRTPITRLRLRADLIEDEEIQRKVISDLDDMEAMIDSTLSFARDDAQTEQGERIDLAVLLETLCDDASDSGHRASYAGPEHFPIMCRPIALQRALTNLIDNAIKYGGGAEVRLAKAEDQAEIAVADDGPGIPPPELEKVFAPFYRLERSRNRSTGGSGLGLAVARSIVRAHGGDVFLSNRPEGGLLARIVLPVQGA